MYEIYKVTNILNDKVYIGQTTQGIKKRFRQHCYQGNALTNAIKKQGKQNFTIEVIKVVNSLKVANDMEIRLIKKFNCLVPNGYNIAIGGDKFAMTDSIKAKISKSMKGKRKSPEHKEKIRLNNILHGEKRKGVKRSIFSQNWKNNMSKSHIGKKLSDDHKDVISKALRGSEKFKKMERGKFFRENNPSKNRILKEKIARSKYKRIYCTNNGICYLSLKLAAEDLGLKVNSVSTALTRGNRIHGYKFYYIY